MKTLKQNYRFDFIDVLRGFTVVLMIIFHFSFDLDYYGLINIDINQDPFWYFFPRLIVFLFLFATGMSLTIAHSKGINYAAFGKRLLLICAWAAVVSAVTYFLFPNSWIYFGTLHAIAVISIFTLPFLKYPKISAGTAIALFLPSMIFDLTLPWFQLAHSSWDYISPFPWVGASLLGVFATHSGLQLISIKNLGVTKILKFLGRHSLIIYLIHQPIIFGLLGIFIKLYQT